MKKLFTILALCITVLTTSMASFADPPFDRGHGPKGPKGGGLRGEWNDRGPGFGRDHDDDRIRDERRMREERGFERLKQHRWQPGYVMPQHYRGNGYKVDYKDSNLPKPGRNQQWYKINNDYILVDTDSNSIVSIRGF
ncbi:RcnB family protein [Acinetobacter pittii]|uniref:RcnB family protein n=1 Tax=Acinetobacter pittii TaxID=48296 RepID=UPI00202DB8AE|nr:RcnB family protein [Acinetobacter pittii]MCM1963705.1 RcnB family protein [Acinetobacter pittii]MCM1980035.1 RcnB family protein [Acinetobacter pittii]